MIATASGRDLTPATSGIATVAATVLVATVMICTWWETPSATSTLVPSGVTAMPLGSVPTAPVAIEVPAFVEVLMACTVLTASPVLPTYACGLAAPDGLTSVKLVAMPVAPAEE
ncbi:MAG: hypothetical protein E6G62_11830 [Actinobacteria bacterium]|nr:MAG: hypothetical protein E6G62_11830 [Actinomycetota bacterium]